MRATDTRQDAAKRMFRAYVTGFVLSIALTLAAYVLVQVHVSSDHEVFTHPMIITTILLFALAQLAVQLLFFLHLGGESRPRWKQMTFLLASIFVLILVLGSLWVMHNLNYRMMPDKINHYMQSQADGGL